MLFAFTSKDKPDGLQLRIDTRPAHVAFLEKLNAEGTLKFAGPFLDDSGQRFGTGMIIFRCATRAEAEKIANSEPYIAHGVRRLKLLPWQKVAGR